MKLVIKNIIKQKDIILEERLFGPDVPIIKGKRTWPKTRRVVMGTISLTLSPYDSV